MHASAGTTTHHFVHFVTVQWLELKHKRNTNQNVAHTFTQQIIHFNHNLLRAFHVIHDAIGKYAYVFVFIW